MKVLLCTSNLPGALLIRWMTGSQWSHCALLSDDGMAIEATWPRVRMVRSDKIVAAHTKSTVIDIPCDAPQAAWDWAAKQVGKPYDLTVLFGWLTGRDWQEDDSWFCSELVAKAFDAGFSPLFRDGSLSRVTPQNLWMIRPC